MVKSDWEDTIRSAIHESNQTAHALAKQADLDHGQLYRFIAGSRSLGIKSAERLCGVLGVTLRPAAPAKQPANKPQTAAE